MREFKSKAWVRAVGLAVVLCMALSGAVAQDAGVPALIDVPQSVTEPDVTIRFTGERGVSYTLHYKYRNIWLLPTTIQLTDTEGEFSVSLGEGENDFVLVEANLPRESADGVPFSIEYVTEAVTPLTVAATATATATTGPTRTPVPPTEPPPTPTPSPSPTPTPSPSPSPTPEPTPEPTPVPTDLVTPEPAEETEGPYDRVLRLWMHGDDVEALQQGLTDLGYKTGRVDGVYGPRTRAAVMRFQSQNGLRKDGLVGPKMRTRLEEQGIAIPQYVEPDMTRPAGFERDLSIGKEGMDVYYLQERLADLGYLQDSPDQVFGKRTRTAVRTFQADNGIKADGVAGPETLRRLFGVDDVFGLEPTAAPVADETPLPETEPPEEPIPEVTPLPDDEMQLGADA